VIHQRFMTARLAGVECSIYGFTADPAPSRRGRFKLFPEGSDPNGGPREEDSDPALEGDDAVELDEEARKLGATAVTHYYEAPLNDPPV
jgi:hypothetical protein